MTPAAKKPLSSKDLFLRKPSARSLQMRFVTEQIKPNLKIASYGFPGTGKTGAIADLAALGYKIFILSTDLCGSGTAAIPARLKLLEKPEAIQNVIEFASEDYYQIEGMIELLSSPDPAHSELVQVREPATGNVIPLWQWEPDIIAWDGFSNFQSAISPEYVLSLSPSVNENAESSEMRQAKIRADDWRDFDAIKRLVTMLVNKFIPCHNPLTGKPVHKYVTMHEKRPREDQNGNVIAGQTPEPLLVGSLADAIAAGFDAFIRMAEVPSSIPGKKRSFSYWINVPNAITKDRFYGQIESRIDNVKPGDFGILWQKMAELVGASSSGWRNDDGATKSSN